ncbi:MAG: GNAT family N-acetyltransferase [Planctomycetales bacterium]|nr:GNAT family N-acetyltransferase [Planctomycetales bacterium]
MIQPSTAIRAARPEDVPQVFAMLQELAAFEKLEHQLTANQDDMYQALFVQNSAKALVAQSSSDSNATNELVGYAIYFENFSTFLCRRGIYLEDVYVRSAYRNRGIGKAFLSHLARIAVDRSCGRMEWSVLDWNKNAIDVYESIGAEILPDWRIVRMDANAISKLALQ